MDPSIKAAILKPYTSPAEKAKVPIVPEYEQLFNEGKAEELLKQASEKLSACVASGDKKGQAEALHAQSLGAAITEDFETAIKSAKQARTIYHSLGSLSDLAFELQAIAYYYLEQNKAQKALPIAQEALTIQKDLGGKSATALYLTVLAFIGKYQRKRAVKVAKENLDKLTDETEKDIAMEALVKAYLSMGATGDAADILADAPQTTSNMFCMAAVNLVSGDYDAAHSSLEDVVEGCEGVGQESAEACLENAKVSIEQKDVQEAIRYANDAKGVFGGDGDTSGEARSVLVVAYAHSMESQYEDAIACATEAQELYTGAGDMKGACLALGLITEVYMMMNSPEKGRETAQQRLTMFEEMGSKRGMGAAQASIAAALADMGILNEAEDMAIKAISNSKGVGDMRSLLASTNVITKVCLTQLSRYIDYEGQELQMKPPKAFIALREKARSRANDAVVYSGKVQDKALRAEALYMRANVMTWCFLPDKALQSAQEAEKLYHEAGDEQGEANALTFCIDLNAMFSNFEKGKECAETAIQICRDLQDSAMEQAVLEAWERLDEKEFGKPKVEEYRAAPVMQMAAGGDFDFGAMAAAGGGGGGGSVAEASGKPKLDPVATSKKLMELVINVMASDDEVAQDSPLMEAGMDSLSSVQFVNEVSREFQMSFSPSLVFDFPTVSALADHIIEAASG